MCPGIAGYWLGWTKNDEGKTRTERIVDNVKNAHFFEFCSTPYIPYDIETLKLELQDHLYGQHIVNATLIPALRSHINHIHHSQKPLVMSFHGTPGTGKNYVSDMIVKHFYAKGDQSKFVHKFRGRIDFPLESEVDFYRVGSLKKFFTLFYLFYFFHLK